MNTRLKRLLLLLILICLTGLSCRTAHAQTKFDTAQKRTHLFDFNWRFHKGGAEGADRPDFDDSLWQKIDLPHDWSIEDLPGTHSPFDSNAVGQVSSGFTTGGVGWYRKTFIVPVSEKGKKAQLQFDGVYMNADIWLNGHHLGNHPYGYTSFWYDITNYIKYGENNVLAVQVKNNGKNSRWYSGSGIYRHVWLTYLEPIHVAHWGIGISTPKADEDTGQINIQTAVRNETGRAANIELITRIIDESGNEVLRLTSHHPVVADSIYHFEQNMTIKNPHLWSVDSPYLYTALTEVYSHKKISDKLATKFGIRVFSFDAVHGLRLNGKSIKLKGGCVHNDNGPLGSKSYDRAEIRKVTLLKASGFNAIRCAHNPPAPALLDACDRMGMLVIDEAFDMWEKGKTPYDYHLYFSQWWKRDIQSMILRDRNHPAVMMWSIGNEVPDMDSPGVAKLAHQLADAVHSIDPSRPVTAAVNNPDAQKDPFFSALDIGGYNYGLYRQNYYLKGHQRKPKRVVFGSESFSPKAFDYWMAVKHHSWVIGDFVWTAWDYIGEAGIGWFNWPQLQNYYPWHLAYTGDIDVCGWKRPQSFYRDALWKKNQLSVFIKPPKPSFHPASDKQWSKWRWEDVVADWNWKGYEGQPFEVHVYSSCEQVELFLNDKSFGKKITDSSTRYMATFQVPYQPGTLKAVGYTGGKRVNTALLRTAQKPSQIHLSADRKVIHANGEDLSYITVKLTDASGTKNPKATNLLHFKINGPGTIAGVGNANPRSTESYQSLQRKAWKGRCLVIIKSGKKSGNITLTVSSKGLPSQNIVIEAN